VSLQAKKDFFGDHRVFPQSTRLEFAAMGTDLSSELKHSQVEFRKFDNLNRKIEFLTFQ
jgi:hypothetical protein